MASVIAEYSAKEPTPASLQMLLKTGRGDLLGHKAAYKQNSALAAAAASHPNTLTRLADAAARDKILLQMACYLRKELPIRLAHRIQDLDQVPALRDQPAVLTVKGIYVDSFKEMVNFPPIRSTECEGQFADMLSALYKKHATVLVQMAAGAYQLREAIKKGEIRRDVQQAANNSENEEEDDDPNSLEFERMEECHAFLDRFYMSRIGIRVLAGQYLALRQQQQHWEQRRVSNYHYHQAPPTQHYIGMISQNTDTAAVVRQAADDASMMCRRQYGRAPRIEVTGCLGLTFPYIPTYLHYVLLELLKNAVRATMETHAGGTLPPVTVIIADGTDQEDVVIKISDEGGGIPRSRVDKIWSYLFTTADPKIQRRFLEEYTTSSKKPVEDHSRESPLAGLGYGLPISRSYCRYFGGDVDIISMEGFGTDAFVHLKRLGDSKEPVPV
jgi:pyruvate dehydrogenase kinase 2/3/4